MRHSITLLTLIASATSSYALTFQGTEYSGFNSLTTSTALNSNANYSQMVGALTDDNSQTGVANIGALTNYPTWTGNNGSLEGTFAKALLSNSSPSNSGIVFFGGSYSGFWGSFNVSLRLADGTYTNAVTFNQNTVTDTGVSIPGNTIIHNIANFGTYITGVQPMTKANIALSAFGSISQDVVGARLTDMTSAWPDLTFIGVYGTLGSGNGGGTPPVPEASTYGIALGGLALAAAVVRRRKQAK